MYGWRQSLGLLVVVVLVVYLSRTNVSPMDAGRKSCLPYLLDCLGDGLLSRKEFVRQYNNVQIRYLGLLPYSDALGMMESIHSELVNNPTQEGAILVVQHPLLSQWEKRDCMKIYSFTEQLKFKGCFS